MTSAAHGSYLSSAKYGYDFVVSTTQASINSGLLAFLSETSQPIEYICFMVDPDTGAPSKVATLDEVIKETGGVNPFDIAPNTPYDDPSISALTKALFVVGIKLQIGLPPGVLPKDLPNVVDLGNSANNVDFNLFCSEFTVIQNTPPSGWGNKGRWDIWSQPSGTPWYFKTRVDLVVADLDKQLDTPYFNNHPAQKAQLKRQLSQLGSTAFSLQQLFFDLDSAVLQTVPVIEGIPPGSSAQDVLQKSFVSLYSTSAKNYGVPLVTVTASIDGPDPSPLQLTSFERQVSPLKDSSGVVIPNPTELQKSVTTLDHLCATYNHPLPGTASFNWNWVLPEEVDSESGIIAINRNSIGNFIMNQLIPASYACCLLATVDVTAHWWLVIDYSVNILPGQRPQTTNITATGPNVVHIEYSSRGYDDDQSAAAYGALEVKPSYTCDVTFSGTSIVITQHALVNLWIQCLSSTEGLRAYDKTITTTYTVSVDQTGGLQLTKSNSTSQDNSEDPDASGFINFFTGINDVCNNIKNFMTNLEDARLGEIPFNQFSNFVFPGSKVFTYKSAVFSDYQDLVCSITYVDPDQQPSAAPPPPEAMEDMSVMASQSMAVSAQTAPSLSLTYSTELMENYVQGEIVSPTSKFEALQTSDGHSLLFGIDSSGVFHVIKEQSGLTKTGWKVDDLSSALIKTKFPNAANATVTSFDVGQSAVDGTIGLAMSVSSGGTEEVFISLSNYSANTSWTSSPSWNHVPFDAIGETSKQITTAGILFAETTSKQQYLVVDVDRSAAMSKTKDIVRYYIDPARATGSYWVKHDVPIDIEHGSYQSCVGRKAKGFVDGIYTSGKTDDAPQLVYVPVVNAFGSGPPLPVRLGLPGGTLPSAIASSRNEDNSNANLFGTTDLYAIGGSTLYRFAADQQHDSATATPVITNDVLSQTGTLLSMTHDGVTTLWGKNGSDEVYYLACPTSQLTVPGSWSSPVPILTGVEHISAYVDRTDGGNTIFASGGGNLYRLTQATNTDAKVWRPQEIKVEASPGQKAISFKSYTTTTHLTDADNQPVRNVKLSVSADARTPVYINGLYYVLSQTAIDVPTDSTGSLTIIEVTKDLNAATLTVAVPNDTQSTIINPMDKSFKKITELNTNDSLRGASFPSKTTAGGVLGPVDHVPLVASSTKDSDVSAVASNLSKLQQVYQDSKPPSSTTRLALPQPAPRVVPSSKFAAAPTLSDIGDDIAIAAGDLFRWLKSGVESVIDFIKDVATGAWHFIAKIAGKVYRAILNTVDAVVGAIEWVFDAIKTAIEDLIRYIEFLFEWDDIRRTKDVLHNVSKLYLQHQVDELDNVRTEFNGQIAAAEQTLNQWAGITDWSPLGDVAGIAATGSTKNPSEGHTSASLLLAHHYKNNAGDLTIVSGSPTASAAQDLIDELLTALSNEGEVLSAVFVQLQKLAGDFSSLSIEDVLKRLAGILADGLLSSVQVVVDALIGVVITLSDSAIETLDTKLHIPIISDILNLLGVPDISFLDLFTWIAAVGYTVIYKIAEGEAPFADNDHVTAIIQASTWDELSALFKQGGGAPNAAPPSDGYASLASSRSAAPLGITIPEGLQKIIYITGHATAGFCLFTGDFVSTFEAEAESGDNPFSIPSAVLGIIIAAMQGGADALVPKDPVENAAVGAISKATTAASIAAKIIFSGPVQKKLGASNSKFSSLAVNDGRATSAIVNSVLVIPALFVSSWHFYELSEKPDSSERSASILGEVTNLTSYVSRIAYAVAVNDKDPTSRQIPIVVMAVANIAAAGLQTAETVIY
ncbi:hypothetical protein G7046_g2635 [Stylonectria norvegica]|nr:hypothetical protein G7046_g2635 [Stylonectria norvegica]